MRFTMSWKILSFQYLYPLRFQAIEKAVQATRRHCKEDIQTIMCALKEQLTQWGITATVLGREKHLYSIYQKMLAKGTRFSQIHDIYGFRVLVNDLPTCYVALGALHALYKPVVSEF